MHSIRRYIFIALFLGLIIGVIKLFARSPIVMFDALSGPETFSEMPAGKSSSIIKYSEGSELSLIHI